jgi:hypothetical protein
MVFPGSFRMKIFIPSFSFENSQDWAGSISDRVTARQKRIITQA